VMAKAVTNMPVNTTAVLYKGFGGQKFCGYKLRYLRQNGNSVLTDVMLSPYTPIPR
jgi:hypothetical protein